MADSKSNRTEEWRPVVGYEPLYRVSNDGRVRGVFKELKPYTHKGQYPRVVLCHNYKRLTVAVHALVAAAFLGERPKNYEVNHKNGIKSDNRRENLEYCTRSENIRHAYATGLNHANSGAISGERHYSITRPELLARGERSGTAVLTESQVKEIRAIHASTKPTYAVLGAHFGVTASAIGQIVRRQAWSHVP